MSHSFDVGNAPCVPDELTANDEHPFDVEPLRFGWRYWHLNHTDTELISAIGQIRGGRPATTA